MPVHFGQQRYLGNAPGDPEQVPQELRVLHRPCQSTTITTTSFAATARTLAANARAAAALALAAAALAAAARSVAAAAARARGQHEDSGGDRVCGGRHP